MTVCFPALAALLIGTAWATWRLCMRYDPNRFHGKLLRHGICGWMLLLGWNLVSGMQLGVNPISVLTTGALGLPGLGLLTVMAMLR